jgi:prostaglandin-H2 D-isomerase / glutathione transferase
LDKILSLRLHYFPFPGRAGAIRDALQMGGISFEDVHVSPEKFRERKAAGELPFGALPFLDVETATTKLRVAQSNAILRFIGRLAGLYSVDDPLLALKVDEALDVGEDIYALLGPSLHEQDNEKKMAMRKILAEEDLPRWIGCIERLLIANGSTGFLVGDSLTVADLKIYWVCDFLGNGGLDGIPMTLFDDLPIVLSWFKNIARVREERLANTARGIHSP